MRQLLRVQAHARSGTMPIGIRGGWALAFWAGWVAIAGAAPSPTEAPQPGSLRVVPARAVLRGPDAVQQIAVERVSPEGTARDTTGGAEFATSDASVATVDAAGTIAARGDGSATITARSGGLEARVSVVVTEFSVGTPV